MKDMELTATEVQTEIEKTVAAIEASKQELARLEAEEPLEGEGLDLIVKTKARLDLLMKKRNRLGGDLARATLQELTTVEEQAKAANDDANDDARRVKEAVEKEVREKFEPHLGVTFEDIITSHKLVIASQNEARLAEGRFLQAHRDVRNFYREHPSME
jgi:hypothetical protein